MATAVAAQSESVEVIEEGRTVEVPAAVVLEAISALYGARLYLTVLNGRVDSGAGEVLAEVAGDLRIAAFGETDGETDEEYERDPVNVATWARESEIVAEMIDRMLRQDGYGLALFGVFDEPEIEDELRAEAEKFRKAAPEISEAGSII